MEKNIRKKMEKMKNKYKSKQKGGEGTDPGNSKNASFFGYIRETIMDFFDKLQTDSNWRSCVFKYLIMTAVLIGISSLVLNIITNPGSASYNTEKYFFIIAFPLIMIFALILNIGKDPAETTSLLKVGAMIVIICAGIYFYSQSSGSAMMTSTYTNYALLALIGLLGLGIMYNTILKYMMRLDGWAGFIVKLIFFIPCILWDLWQYIFEQFKITSFAIYGILILELLLILLYVYLPNISNSVTGLTDGTQLLTNTMFLDKETRTIATSDVLKVSPSAQQISNGNGINGQYRTNYCISMWVYLNPQNPSMAAYSKETEIFKYGFTDASGIQHVKPMIRYYGGGDGTDQLVERDKYVFYFAKYPPTEQYNSSGDTFYDISLPNQRWNQIVLNYNRNSVDLFINGSLERSFNMANVLPVYNDLDTITVGSLGGLKGAICNVVYYNHPLSADQIAFSYNTLVGSDPPVPRVQGQTVAPLSPSASR